MRDALPFTIGKKEKIDCIFLQKNISEGKLQHNALMETCVYDSKQEQRISRQYSHTEQRDIRKNSILAT